MIREVYQHNLRLHGPTDEDTLTAVCNVANSLANLGRYEASVRTIRRHVGPAQKELGADHDVVLKLQHNLAISSAQAATSRKGLTEALSSMQAVYERRLRVFGAAHPHTRTCERDLAKIWSRLGGV